MPHQSAAPVQHRASSYAGVHEQMQSQDSSVETTRLSEPPTSLIDSSLSGRAKDPLAALTSGVNELQSKVGAKEAEERRLREEDRRLREQEEEIRMKELRSVEDARARITAVEEERE